MAIEKYIVCDRCGKQVSYYSISYERITFKELFYSREIFLCRKCFDDFRDFLETDPKKYS